MLLQEVVYGTVRKQNIPPLQDMKNGFMMALKQKKVKPVKSYTATSSKSDSTSVIYPTTVKVAQCRQVAENRIKEKRRKRE